MTRTLAVIGLGVSCLLADNEPRQTLQVTNTQRVDFASGGALRLANSVGELAVQGWDRPYVEITTVKSTKASSSFMECPTCSGDGTVRTPEAAARSAFRKIQARVARGDIAGVKVYLPPEVALYLLNEKLSADEALALGMVHAVRPAAELRDHVYAIAAQLVHTPAELLALVKDNLNQAEDEIDRLRFLFANEAHNQAEAGKAMAARMQKRGAT